MERNPEIQRDSTTVDQPPRDPSRRARAAASLGPLALRQTVQPPSGDTTEAWVGPASSTPSTTREPTRRLGRLAVREAQRDRSR